MQRQKNNQRVQEQNRSPRAHIQKLRHETTNVAIILEQDLASMIAQKELRNARTDRIRTADTALKPRSKPTIWEQLEFVKWIHGAQLWKSIIGNCPKTHYKPATLNIKPKYTTLPRDQ